MQSLEKNFHQVGMLAEVSMAVRLGWHFETWHILHEDLDFQPPEIPGDHALPASVTTVVVRGLLGGPCVLLQPAPSQLCGLLSSPCVCFVEVTWSFVGLPEAVLWRAWSGFSETGHSVGEQCES